MGADYDKICDFQNLYEAHLKARLGKRDKLEVIHFEMNLAENLARMSTELEQRRYKMRGYYHFSVYEPKKREIYAAHYRDRVLLHCVCDQVLMPLVERHVIYDNAACRKGKGTHFALDRFSGFLRQHYKRYGRDGYVLKCDISKYFASINHEVLLSALRRIVDDDDVFELMHAYIKSFETTPGCGRGLPLGNQSSQCFALYYLDSLDHMIKEQLRVKHYIRYMDDFLLLHHDRAFLEDALCTIRDKVENDLDLKLNPNTQIVPLKCGVTFLGWRFFLTENGRVVRRLRRQSKLRYKRRMIRLAHDRASERIDDGDVVATVASYRGHLKHGDAHALQQKVEGDFWNTLHADRCRLAESDGGGAGDGESDELVTENWSNRAIEHVAVCAENATERLAQRAVVHADDANEPVGQLSLFDADTYKQGAFA